MPDEKLTIDLHNGWSRGAQRLLGVSFPLWGIVGPLMVFQSLQSHDCGAWLFAGALISMLGFACSYCVRNNRLTITNGILRLPVIPHMMGSFPLSEVVSVTLYKPSIIERYFRSRLPRPEPVCTDETGNVWVLLKDHRILDLGLDRLSGDRLQVLLREIKKAAADVCIDRRVIAESTYGIGSVAPDPHSAVVIKYDRQTLFSELRILLLAHEIYFWRVWSAFWALAAAFFYVEILFRLNSPRFCCIESTRDCLSPLEAVVDWIAHQFSLIGDAPMKYYCNLVMTPPGTVVMLGAALLLAASAVAVSLRPNELVLTADKLLLRRRLFGMELDYFAVPWRSITSAELVKPPRPSPVDRRKIRLICGSEPPRYLNLRGIAGEEERKLLLNCLEAWAPQASRDHELIFGLADSRRKSYTELWLQSLAAPPKRERLTALPTGTALKGARYEVRRQIGAGGQGVAYLACDRLNSSASLVLKEYLLPVYVDRNARCAAMERFEREARILLALDHPQIVKLHDYFVEDHRGYLCLEHINGQSLRAIFGREDSTADGVGQECTPALAVTLARQMCSILAYLHALAPAIVHRDFTPDNLILNKSGTLKLIDFNVALAQDCTKMRTGTVVGKQAYLPPEQFRGRPVPASDIYAFGASLYFLLSGRDPEPLAESDISAVRADLPTALVELIRKCTQVEACERYAKIGEIAAMLDRLKAELEPHDAGCTVRMPEDLFSEIQI